ncbi:hypothetical protein SO802_014262 [Lithocarpus litseifolius]|uniref:CCHC-type domain-containing protein n=1 Tax=Lithocarpus litseifolius TaxID=425828 RepID=A0AAW2CTY9_9ROSI
MSMVAITYMNNHDLDHPEIVELLSTGFTGTLRGWWDSYLTEDSRESIKRAVKMNDEGFPIFDEKRNSGIPDGVNTLIHTILKHFVGTFTNVSSRVSDYLNNLRCPTMSDYRWYHVVFLSRVMLRKDCKKPYWKEKFIDDLPPLFAHKTQNPAKGKCFNCGKSGHYSKDCKAKPGNFKNKLNMLNINDKDQEDLIRILDSNTSSDSFDDDLSSSDSCYHSADESSDSPNIKLGCRDSCCNTIHSVNTLTKHEENEKLLISLINQIQNPELQKEYLDRHEIESVKKDNNNINQELLILKLDKSIDKHQSDNEQDEPKEGDDSSQQALLPDTESSLRILAATITTSKWINVIRTTSKWNIMSSSSSRKNKGKAPARDYPQDKRIPAGQSFVMHEEIKIFVGTNPMSFTKNWYTKPTPPDMQFEERIFQSQFSVSADKLYEWNIDGLSEQEIINKMGHMSMVAITYMNNHDLDHPEIVELLSTGFTGTLRGWWDSYLTEDSRESIKRAVKMNDEGFPIFDEKRNSGIPDGVNTLIHTILKHFVGTLTNISSRVSDYLNNLRCPTMSDYRWYHTVFLSRVMLRKDCKKRCWKEKFIDGLPPLFAHKVKQELIGKNDSIDYENLTYGDILSTINKLGINMCNDEKLLKDKLKNKRKAKYEMGNFCEQYGLPPIDPSRQKRDKHDKIVHKSFHHKKHKTNFVKPNDFYNKKKTVSKKHVHQNPSKGKCFNCGKSGHYSKDCKEKPGKLKNKLNMLNINDNDQEDLFRILESNTQSDSMEDDLSSSDSCYHSADDSSDSPNIKLGCRDSCCNVIKSINTLTKHEEKVKLLISLINQIQNPELQKEYLDRIIPKDPCCNYYHYKWNIMSSSASRKNKGKAPARDYPQDKRIPAGQSFVMHEGASSRRNPSRSKSLQEYVPAEALEIHLVNLTAQNEVYEGLIIDLDSQIRKNPVDQPLPHNEAFASHSIHHVHNTSQLPGKEEIHSMDKMTLMGTDYAKLSLMTQFSIRCAVANLPSDIQKCIFERKAMFRSFDLWYDYFKKLVTAPIPDPDELDEDDNVFIQLDWEEYFGKSSRVYERKIHPFPGLLINYEDDELDEEDMDPDWLSQMFEFGFIRMIRVSNRDQLDQLPRIIQQVVARTRSPSVTIRCWSTLPKWDTDNWMNVQPSKHLILVNGYTHQGPWYKGNSYLSYRNHYALAECWGNYFNNQILEVIQNLWKDYHFEGHTDRITVFGLKPYGIATQHLSIADYINPKNFTNPLKSPVYEHLLYCGFCNHEDEDEDEDEDDDLTFINNEIIKLLQFRKKDKGKPSRKSKSSRKGKNEKPQGR